MSFKCVFCGYSSCKGISNFRQKTMKDTEQNGPSLVFYCQNVYVTQAKELVVVRSYLYVKISSLMTLYSVKKVLFRELI